MACIHIHIDGFEESVCVRSIKSGYETYIEQPFKHVVKFVSVTEYIKPETM